MSLLEFLLKEYLSIVAKLEETETVENNRIIIDRDYFRNLLEKYPYITFRDKTKVYKALLWTLGSQGHWRDFQCVLWIPRL